MKKHFNFKSVYRAALVALCLLTIGVGNMWGEDFTVYVTGGVVTGTGDNAWDNQKSVIKVDVRFQGNDYDFKESDVYKEQEMTCTDYTYNGYPIYSYTFTPTWGGGQFRFKHYKNKEWKEDYTSDWHSTTEQIYRGYYNDGHQWMVYGRDVTVYTVPEYLFKDYSTKFSEDKHYPSVCVQYGVGVGEWKTIDMVKTDYTYDNYPIWKATFLLDYNIFKEFQIKYFDKANSQQVGLYQYNQGGNTEYPSSDLDDKLYHGWNGESHDFFPYTYDVKLDQQDGSGGTESIKATDGADLPVATMPGRDGYIFGGYYTEVGGNGDMYYGTNGNSSTQWNSRTITTLYAKWTAREYTVRLEDMEPTTAGQGSVSVTFDASDNMTSAVTQPTKTHYDFRGYWTDNNDSGATLDEPLIDENGNWIKDVSPYTGSDADENPTWIYPNDISLFAKWEEHPYTITPSVSPAGAGSVNTVTDAHLVTPSSDITATPTNAVWVFDHWICGTNVGIAGGKGTGDNPVTVTASQNSTITAYFKHRYNLLGSKYEEGKDKAEMETGGMPGWTYGSGADFTINSYTADGDDATVDLSYTCTLEAGTYIFEIHDRQKGESLGREGDGGGIYQLTDGNSVQLRGGTDKDQSIFFYPQHAGQYTFRITYMTKDGNYYYPTVTIERPHQLHMGHVYAGIDNTSGTNSGDTGGTLTAAISESSISNGDWFNYGSDIAYTASPATGYTVTWYTDDNYSSEFGDQPSNSWTDYNVTHDENVYVRFIETSTSVTLANDGHGKVQIGGVNQTITTCGVTTTRELTAVPNAGYKFKNWTTSSSPDFEVDDDDAAEVTLTGHGAGTAGTLTANFVERYSIKGTMNGENWGTTHTLSNIGTNAGSKDTCYVTMTLPANTTYEFAIYDEQTTGWYKAGTDAVYGMTYTNHTNWEFGDSKTYNCGITTAGKGTYKFIFNITDKTVTVVYPTSYQVNYGAAVGGSVTSVLDDDGKEIPNGGYVRKGGSVTYEATASDGYTFTGWCPNDSYGGTFTNHNPWENSNVTATSNAYAKFHSTNFVIYRTGDKASDPRAVWDDVESYDGGTISETIEFRMKVNELDFWYTLCLPFEVNAVQVWEDGAFYDIVPYWRTEGKYYTGHYILRKPVTPTNFAIEGFEGKDRWIDPESSNVLPSKNIPYIIQWHDEYFLDKYISFFGSAGQTIPTDMDEGNYASSDETVNIYGNNSMTTGTVRDAYLLDPYYGTDGAWMREEIGTDRSVLPFECFILANEKTTAKYRVLRRDMADDTPTGLDTLSMTEDTVSKVLIDNRIYIIRGGKIYTIQGTFVKEVE